MKLTWLGHSGFRLEIEDAVILIDPWLSGNPMFPEGRRADAISGATESGLNELAQIGVYLMATDQLLDWLSRSRQAA